MLGEFNAAYEAMNFTLEQWSEEGIFMLVVLIREEQVTQFKCQYIKNSHGQTKTHIFWFMLLLYKLNRFECKARRSPIIYLEDTV